MFSFVRHHLPQVGQEHGVMPSPVCDLGQSMSPSGARRVLDSDYLPARLSTVVQLG